MRELKLPETSQDFMIKMFCFRSAALVFCTVSGLAKLKGQKIDLTRLHS